jgi:molybdate transport system substrate-binding protein
MRVLSMVLLLSFFLALPTFAAEIRLSVAASMTDAVKDLIATHGKNVEDVTFLPNFGSSGSLAKQIEQGAPTDIFISANAKWMDHLVESKHIPAANIRPFAYNTLVFVGSKKLAVATLADVAELQHIAIGSPKSVPAGQYAEQALKAAGLYDRMQGKLVMAKDVRQALIYADRGETDGAFVYQTDALLAKDSVILLEVPQTLYDEIIYPISLTVEGAGKPEAVAFYQFLLTEEARQILKRYGFIVR